MYTFARSTYKYITFSCELERQHHANKFHSHNIVCTVGKHFPFTKSNWLISNVNDHPWILYMWNMSISGLWSVTHTVLHLILLLASYSPVRGYWRSSCPCVAATALPKELLSSFSSLQPSASLQHQNWPNERWKSLSWLKSKGKEEKNRQGWHALCF